MPSNGSACTKPLSGEAPCHMPSSSTPSIVGASATLTAEASGRAPGSLSGSGDDRRQLRPRRPQTHDRQHDAENPNT